MQEQEHSWQMPDWWCRKKRPPNDKVYFENMCRVIFQAGLNWHVTDKKWPETAKVFCNFDIACVARFTEADVERLLENPGIIRNKRKIQGIILNARNFLAIEKRYGSFHGYLDSLDKTNNYAGAIKDLINKFTFLGPSTAKLYLYTVGENIDPW